MKLIKCYVENFGKLQKFTFNFKDGLNTIKEENGFGKTTFATFIKSMFYGLDNSKSEKSERKKYKPWQGGIFGGNIEFEVNEKKYRIERSFGNKASDDVFKLYDLSTNLESLDYSENIGEEIFKINKSGYERSTYIPQGQIQIEMEDSLNAKLGNILEGDNDVNNSDEAIKLLSDTMRIYKKIGNKGLLNEKKEELNELQRKLENSRFDDISLEDKEKRYTEIKMQIEQIEKERKEKQDLLSKKIENGRKQVKLETYNNILSNLREEETKYNELKDVVDSGASKDNEFQNLSKKVEKIDIELEEKDNKIYSLKKEIGDLQQRRKEQCKTSKIILIISIIIIISGIVVEFLDIPKAIGIIIAGFGVIGIVLSVIKYNNKKLTKKFDECKNILNDTEASMNELQVLRQEINDSMNRILMYFKNELVNTREKMDKTIKQKEDFESLNNIDELKKIDMNLEIDEDDLNKNIYKLNNNIDRLSDEKNQIKNQIEVLENKIDENEYLETDIEKLKEEIYKMDEKYKVLEKTKKLLEMAKNKFSSNHLKEMTDSFEEYLSIIDNKNLETTVDVNLDVKVDVNGVKKEAKYFSAGYKDLIYICMRFSLVKALFKEELPFVILDDPFVNLDEEKTNKALEFIDNLAKEYQIIYLVCNGSRIS